MIKKKTTKKPRTAGSASRSGTETIPHSILRPQGRRKGRTTGGNPAGFTDAERDAMRARAKELRAETSAGKNRAAGEKAVRAAIAEMPKADRTMATLIHAIVKGSAPELMPKTWYGMPAYADTDGKVVCFFQSAHKFKARYATFGFNDAARLDDGNLWPTSFALKKLTAAEEKIISALVRRAASL